MTESRASWIPPVPSILQRLFDKFPLVTYRPNELPARSPGLDNDPCLFVFAREEDEHRGFPSFNPSCLKWQLFLKLADVTINVTPSSNHASPTGSLPFLLAPRASYFQPTVIVPSSKLYDYAVRHGKKKVPEIDHLPLEAYQALLDGPIRKAYLHALYLNSVSSDLLKQLYIKPSSSALPIQATLSRQLRHTAEAEILKATPGAAAIDATQLYVEARDAFAALEALLRSSRTEWFWNAESPTLFDAAVFAYTGLLMSGSKHSLWPEAVTKPAELQHAIEGAEAARLGKHQHRLWNVLLPAE